jgi:CYTH domain-containing protein
VNFAFDVFLGELWGLNMARVDFENVRAMSSFEPPPFAVFEVTSDPFFSGENLVAKTFADVQTEVERIGPTSPRALVMPDE